MRCSSDTCDGVTYTGTFVRCPACAAAKAPKGTAKQVVVSDRVVSVPDGSLSPKTQSYGPSNLGCFEAPYRDVLHPAIVGLFRQLVWEGHDRVARGLVAFARWVREPCR